MVYCNLLDRFGNLTDIDDLSSIGLFTEMKDVSFIKEGISMPTISHSIRCTLIV